MWKPRFPDRRKRSRGFAKVHLAVGQCQRMQIVAEDRAVAFFDVMVGQRCAEAGAFEISAGISVSDLRSVTGVQKTAAFLAV